MIVGVLCDVLAVPAPQRLRVEPFNVTTGEAFWLPLTSLERQRASADGALRQADLRLHESVAAYLIKKQALDARAVAVLTMAADRRADPSVRRGALRRPCLVCRRAGPPQTPAAATGRYRLDPEGLASFPPVMRVVVAPTVVGVADRLAQVAGEGLRR